MTEIYATPQADLGSKEEVKRHQSEPRLVVLRWVLLLPALGLAWLVAVIGCAVAVSMFVPRVETAVFSVTGIGAGLSVMFTAHFVAPTYKVIARWLVFVIGSLVSVGVAWLLEGSDALFDTEWRFYLASILSIISALSLNLFLLRREKFLREYPG